MYILQSCTGWQSEPADCPAHYSSARSPPRPAVTWPATSPHRTFCHILARSAPHSTVTWPAVIC